MHNVAMPNMMRKAPPSFGFGSSSRTVKSRLVALSDASPRFPPEAQSRGCGVGSRSPTDGPCACGGHVGLWRGRRRARTGKFSGLNGRCHARARRRRAIFLEIPPRCEAVVPARRRKRWGGLRFKLHVRPSDIRKVRPTVLALTMKTPTATATARRTSGAGPPKSRSPWIPALGAFFRTRPSGTSDTSDRPPTRLTTSAELIPLSALQKIGPLFHAHDPIVLVRLFLTESWFP